MSANRLSRRQMLKLLGTGALSSLVIAACGGAPAAAPATSAAPAPAATAAPAVAPAVTAAPAAAPTAVAAVPTAAPAEPPTPTPAVGGINENASVVLNFLTWGGGGAITKLQGNYDTLSKVYPELGQKIGIKGLAQGGDFGVAQSLRLALAAGQGIPDMVQLNRTQVAEFADELMDLEAAFAPVKDDLYAGALAVATYGGKFVAYPMEVKSKIFFYRGDMFDQAGIKVEAIKSTADFINAGKALRAKFPKTYMLNLGPQPVQYWIGEFLSAYPDARFADEGGNYQVKTNPAFADTFTFMKEIQDSGIALAVDDWTTDWQPSFAQEAIGASLLANWMKFFLPTFAPKQAAKWKVANWPALAPLADQKFGSEAGGSVVVVPKRAPHVQEAMDYLNKTFLDKKGSVALFQNGFVTPLLKSAQGDVLDYVHNAKKPADMKDEDWAALPQNFFGPDYQQFEFSTYDNVKVFNYDPSATKEIDILRQWLIKYLAGSTQLNDALASAQADMEGQIGNPYQV
jgi:multiple sugar transport system substrate-binding protein